VGVGPKRWIDAVERVSAPGGLDDDALLGHGDRLRGPSTHSIFAIFSLSWSSGFSSSALSGAISVTSGVKPRMNTASATPWLPLPITPTFLSVTS
jgi:hypothetical protein